jgi:hypothetical protein
VPKKSVLKKLFKFFFWLLIVFVLLIISAIALVFIYEDDVKGIVITELNKNLNAEIRIDPKNIDLTIIKTFPDCALEFKQITCMEAIKSEKRDTLLFAGSLQLKFDVEDLWNKKYDINEIKLADAFCRLKISSKGKPNYIVWKESETKTNEPDSLKFSLELIEFTNVKISYNDLKNKFRTDAHIDEVSFSGKFNEDNYNMQSQGSMLVKKIRSNKVDLLKNKNIIYKADLQVSGNTYHINLCEVQLNKMFIEAKGNIVYNDSLSDLDVNFKGKNLDIQSVLSLLPESYKNKINDYKSEGNFYASGNLKYRSAMDLNIEFGVNNTTIIYEPKNANLKNLNAKGKYVLNKNNSSLELRNVSGDLMNDHFEGNMILTNLNDPYLDLDLKGKLNLNNVMAFWPIDTLTKLKGEVAFQTRIKSNVEALKKNILTEDAIFDLSASLSKLVIQFKKQADSTSINTCELKALNRSLEVTNLGIHKGRSDLLIDGRIEGAYSYLMDSKSALKIYGNLKSNIIAVEDFLFDDNGTSKTEIDVPDNINFILDAAIESLSFGKFNATKLNGNIELKNKKVFAENVTLNAMDGAATIDALMDLSGKNLNVSLHSELNNINVSKLFTQFNNFDQQTLVDQNIGGALTATIDFSGDWNKFLEPDLNSMKSISDLRIDQGKLVDFKPLESLSKFVDINDLKSIKFSSLQSHIEISKSVITIPKTAIKNSALNIDLWGSHSFNNDIDYHIQLLISELLAKKRKGSADEEFGLIENDPENRRSAFVLMTGTVDKPVIKYDRKGLKQKIKEDIKQEKQNLKQILKEEFGVFKKDSIKTKDVKKSDQTFKLEKEQPKKKKEEKEEEDEDF